MIKELKTTLSQLANKDFLYAFMEPLLFWGVSLGIIAFMLSLWVLKDPRAQTMSLLLILVACAGIWPVTMWRPKNVPRTAISAAAWKDVAFLRLKYQWVYYGLGGLVLATHFLREKKPLGDILCAAVIAGGLATVTYSLWLHEKSIRLYHPDVVPERTDLRLSFQTPSDFPTV